MNIDCGKYIIKSDPLNLWIEQKYRKQDGGEATRMVTGYQPNYEHLFESFVHHRVKAVEAEDAKILLQEIKDIEADLLELAANLGKQLDRGDQNGNCKKQS